MPELEMEEKPVRFCICCQLPIPLDLWWWNYVDCACGKDDMPQYANEAE